MSGRHPYWLYIEAFPKTEVLGKPHNDGFFHNRSPLFSPNNLTARVSLWDFQYSPARCPGSSRRTPFTLPGFPAILGTGESRSKNKKAREIQKRRAAPEKTKL
jgi:hypothetical protein